MENDHCDLFNSETLSFDSTLEGLVDVDYALDDKSFPFDTAYGLPSDILMSAQKTIGSDVSFLDGGTMESKSVDVKISTREDSEKVRLEEDRKEKLSKETEIFEAMVVEASSSDRKSGTASIDISSEQKVSAPDSDKETKKYRKHEEKSHHEKSKESRKRSEKDHSRRKHSESERSRLGSRQSEQRIEKVEISIEIKEKDDHENTKSEVGKDNRKEVKRKAEACASASDDPEICLPSVGCTSKSKEIKSQTKSSSSENSTNKDVDFNAAGVEPPAKRMKIDVADSVNDTEIEKRKTLSLTDTGKVRESSKDDTKKKERKSDKESSNKHSKSEQKDRKDSKSSKSKSDISGSHQAAAEQKSSKSHRLDDEIERKTASNGKLQNILNNDKSKSDKNVKYEQNDKTSSTEKAVINDRSSSRKSTDQQSKTADLQRQSTEKSANQTSAIPEKERTTVDKSTELRSKPAETGKKLSIEKYAEQREMKRKPSVDKQAELKSKSEVANSSQSGVYRACATESTDKMSSDKKEQGFRIVTENKMSGEHLLEQKSNHDFKDSLQCKDLSEFERKSKSASGSKDKNRGNKPVNETHEIKKDEGISASTKNVQQHKVTVPKTYRESKHLKGINLAASSASSAESNVNECQISPTESGEKMTERNPISKKVFKENVNAFKATIDLENQLFSEAIGIGTVVKSNVECSSSSSDADKTTDTIVGETDSSLNDSMECKTSCAQKRKETKQNDYMECDASNIQEKQSSLNVSDLNESSENLQENESIENVSIEEAVRSDEMHLDIPTNEGYLEFVTSDIERNIKMKVIQSIQGQESIKGKTNEGVEMEVNAENDLSGTEQNTKDESRNEEEMNVDTEFEISTDAVKEAGDKADIESIDSYDEILTAENYEDDIDEEDVEDFDIDDDELHGWLEEGVSTGDKKVNKRPEDLKEGEYISSEKPVLEEKGSCLFDVLPKGWIMLTHNSGMPVYLHKETRVCTFSRPYNIGPGSVRKHEIPISTIPCLHYRRELEKEKKEAESGSKTEQQVSETALPKITVKTADEAMKNKYISCEALNTYCKGLFHFNTVEIKRFKTWREKRAHLVQERKKNDLKVPRMGPDTKLITCPIPNTNPSKKRKKEFVMNPEGKTGVCILHEYTQNVLRLKPSYEFEEIQHPEFPFQATVVLNGIKYGSGIASSKKNAKNEAAKATLEIFFPEIKGFWSDGAVQTAQTRKDAHSELNLEFFKDIAIDDPRIPDLCLKSSLPQPYQVLQVCLKRNFGLGDTSFKVDKKTLSSQKTEFTLTVGKRTCTVIGKNKREAKQRAAQAMLQQLHPEVKNWAAINQLYGNVIEIEPMKKDEIYSLDEFTKNRTEKKKNFQLLEKLKLAMRKVKDSQMNDASTVTSTIAQAPSVSL